MPNFAGHQDGEALGRAGDPCHLAEMSDAETPPPKKPRQKASDDDLSREEKLAKALRENLKRRKAKKD
ncbi:MAG: hypothetical protein AAGH41_06455 [Pseudomonadota bacterium]